MHTWFFLVDYDNGFTRSHKVWADLEPVKGQTYVAHMCVKISSFMVEARVARASQEISFLVYYSNAPQGRKILFNENMRNNQNLLLQINQICTDWFKCEQIAVHVKFKQLKIVIIDAGF